MGSASDRERAGRERDRPAETRTDLHGRVGVGESGARRSRRSRAVHAHRLGPPPRPPAGMAGGGPALAVGTGRADAGRGGHRPARTAGDRPGPRPVRAFRIRAADVPKLAHPARQAPGSRHHGLDCASCDHRRGRRPVLESSGTAIALPARGCGTDRHHVGALRDRAHLPARSRVHRPSVGRGLSPAFAQPWLRGPGGGDRRIHGGRAGAAEPDRRRRSRPHRACHRAFDVRELRAAAAPHAPGCEYRST